VTTLIHVRRICFLSFSLPLTLVAFGAPGLPTQGPDQLGFLQFGHLAKVAGSGAGGLFQLLFSSDDPLALRTGNFPRFADIGAD
jgi:hypothetical protein